MIKYKLGKKELKAGILHDKGVFGEEFKDLVEILEIMLKESPNDRPDFIELRSLLNTKSQNFQRNKDNQKKEYEEVLIYYRLFLKRIKRYVIRSIGSKNFRMSTSIYIAVMKHFRDISGLWSFWSDLQRY